MGVELLTERYQSQIAGVLSCYDRIIIQGTIPKWCYAKGMTDYFYEHNIRIFDYPKWAEPLRDAIRRTWSVSRRQAGSRLSSCGARRAFARRNGSRRCWPSAEMSPGGCAFCRRWSPARAINRGMTKSRKRHTRRRV